MSEKKDGNLREEYTVAWTYDDLQAFETSAMLTPEEARGVRVDLERIAKNGGIADVHVFRFTSEPHPSLAALTAEIRGALKSAGVVVECPDKSPGL